MTTELKTRKAAEWMRHLPCQADCERPLERGQLVVVVEKSGHFVANDRYRIWHYDCHPTVVDRRYARIIRHIERTGSLL